MKHIALVFLLACSSTEAFQAAPLLQQHSLGRSRSVDHGVRLQVARSSDDMMQAVRTREAATPLNAMSLADSATEQTSIPSRNLQPFEQESQSVAISSDFKLVATTALLITGNTVGAGALVLPEKAAPAGLVVSTSIFAITFIINLISGLMTAEVAIKQKEDSGDGVPSSLNEFADATLNSPTAANAISAVSMFTNCCILSFGLVRAGSIAAALTGAAQTLEYTSAAAAGLIGAMVLFSGEQLASLASVAVAVLFASFGALLFPGLASVQDPVAAFMAPGTDDNMMSAVAEAAPIILTTSIYQNIVPSVTKILDYDRTKTTIALTVGSAIPILMYIAWCFAVIGGNVDPNAGAGGPIVTAFSIAAVTGSVIGCAMSLTEEVEALMPIEKKDCQDVFSLPAAAAAVGVPLAVALAFAGGEDFSAALKMAGSYGSPFLYGVVPVLMAWTQRQKLKDAKDMVPGGMASLGLVALTYGGFILGEFAHDMINLFAR